MFTAPPMRHIERDTGNFLSAALRTLRLLCLLLPCLLPTLLHAAPDHPPIKQRSHWTPAFRVPLAKRFGVASPLLIEYITRDNERQGFPNRPRAPALTPDFSADVAAALRTLPAPVKRAIEAKFAGVYFVDDLGGTGWTEELLDEKGQPVAGVIVLDAAVLAKLSANAWATWKENTPFKPDAHWRLAAEIERAGEDNRRQAIQYILLHELGHVLAIGTRLHPSADLAPKDAAAHGPYTYYPLSWQGAPGDKYLSRFDAAFTTRREAVYYLGAKLEGARMEEAYRQLQATNFPTLYAATNPLDDFAEAFVTYVHTEMQQRPFAVRLYRDDKLVMSYGPCWKETRCGQKRRVVEGALGLRRK